MVFLHKRHKSFDYQATQNKSDFRGLSPHYLKSTVVLLLCQSLIAFCLHLHLVIWHMFLSSAAKSKQLNAAIKYNSDITEYEYIIRDGRALSRYIYS